MKQHHIDLALRRLVKFSAPKETELNRKLNQFVVPVAHVSGACVPCVPISKAFILLILACSWLQLPPPEQEVQVLELFAGQARLTRLAKSLGFGTAAHDIQFDKAASSGDADRSATDINESAGFVFLVHLILNAESKTLVIGNEGIMNLATITQLLRQVNPLQHLALPLGRPISLSWRAMFNMGGCKFWNLPSGCPYTDGTPGLSQCAMWKPDGITVGRLKPFMDFRQAHTVYL